MTYCQPYTVGTGHTVPVPGTAHDRPHFPHETAEIFHNSQHCTFGAGELVHNSQPFAFGTGDLVLSHQPSNVGTACILHDTPSATSAPILSAHQHITFGIVQMENLDHCCWPRRSEQAAVPYNIHSTLGHGHMYATSCNVQPAYTEVY